MYVNSSLLFESHVASGCFSLSPSPHPFLLSKTPHFSVISLFDYADVAYIPTLPTSAKSCTAYPKFLSPLLYCDIAPLLCLTTTTTCLHIIRNLAGLKFGNVLFSTCAVLYFPSFAPILFYICDVSFQLNFEHYSSFNLLVTKQDTKITYPFQCISPLSSVLLSPTRLLNILIPILIQ